MIRYFLRSFAAHLRGGRLLYLLALSGVALGVASVLSIQVINQNALAAFEGGVRAVGGDADLSIVPRGAALAETIYPDVLADPGVAAAWPLCRADVALAGRPGVVLEVVGVDLFAPRRIPWKDPPGDLSRALGDPGWIAIAPSLARDLGRAVGDPLEVTSGSRRVSLRVGALVDFRRTTPLAGRRLAVMDIAQAQSLFGRRGEIDEIGVRAAEGTDRAALAARLRARLGPQVSIVTPEQRERQASALLGAFRLNLTALSLISLFVGAFLVYSSTQASLVRRRSEFGVLRSLGATRAQILALILGEVAILGALGVAIGLPLGYAAARANLRTVSATISNLYLLESIESLRLSPSSCLLAAALGLGGAAAGALLPALDMSRRDTRSLLAAYTLHERIGAAARPLALAGCALLAATALWYLAAGKGWRPAGFVVGVAVLLAVPLVTPSVIRAACGRVRASGFSIGYGLKSLALRLPTAAFATAALAIAVSMLFGITLMIGSFRRTLEIWIGGTIRADVYVSTESWRRGRRSAVLDDELVATLRSFPGVRAADRLRQFLAYVGDRRVPVSGVDMALPGGAARFALLEGDPGEAQRRARDEGAILIGEPLARAAGLRPGDRLGLPAPSGEARFPIAGVYYDYGSESGSVVMDLRTMEAAFGPGPINNVALYLDPGRDPEETVAALKTRFAGRPLRVRSNRGLRREILSIFDQTFAVTRLLQGMSLLIAVSGVTLTLLVLARERVSELALYRALGASRGQILEVFLGKGIGMAIFALAIGGPGGVALAMVLVFLINRAYFGWTIAPHWPGAALAGQAAAILAASVLASLYPAARAADAPATELSRDDL